MPPLFMASCSRNGRRILWNQLSDFASTVSGPWLVGGDFNCISSPNERVGDFKTCGSSMLPFYRLLRIIGRLPWLLRITFLEKEEVYWRQKASSKFLVEGDRNTKFFHNIANHNKISRQIHKISHSEGDIIENPDAIAFSGTDFFSKLFKSNFTPMLDTDFSFIPPFFWTIFY
ncbi:uncharacterized protein LOC114579946 isoform X2 [Dendrobium catenatum]|uniref:uncharacterized protein LOC114579946 isoform X2 n=1 Tax=Dendrobium catenatum TaxID=906689 RepID=UPI00109F0470|nr:uncharacterized protein LOC114579946 isoform X2 [Dendrobium catenatum]